MPPTVQRPHVRHDRDAERRAGPHRPTRRTVVAAFVVVQLALTLGTFHHAYAQNWAFVGCYLVTAIYAAWLRAWLPTAAALAVALVRGMVAEGYAGKPYTFASAVFAALFFLLCVDDAERSRNR